MRPAWLPYRIVNAGEQRYIDQIKAIFLNTPDQVVYHIEGFVDGYIDEVLTNRMRQPDPPLSLCEYIGQYLYNSAWHRRKPLL